MTTFFTSDEHYGHQNIIGFCNRPFDNVGHQTEELIRRHNAVVGHGDTVWHLGDFCWKEKLVPEVLRRLNGLHCLVVGNHDTCHPMHKRAARAKEFYHEAGFTLVAVESEFYAHPTRYLMHHMPYVSDSRHDEKYAEWRPKDHGLWLLHGHIHDLWKMRGRMINVGVDVWSYAPVSIEEIEALRKAAPERSTWE